MFANNMYKISAISFQNAKEIGVVIKPSKKKNKKIDVFDKNGVFKNTIGNLKYKDYPTYLKEEGKKYADDRKRLYKIRHEKDRHVKDSKGYYADRILWSN